MAGEAEIIAGVSSDIGNLSDLQVVDQVINTQLAAEAAEPAAPAELDADATETVEDVIDQAVAEETAADADPKPDAEAAITEPEPDPAKPASTDTTADDEEVAGLSIASLNKVIEKTPELKAALEKDPGLKKQLFQNARRSERANQYDELFATPALAKEAKTAADAFYETRQLFEGDDSTKFLQKLVYDSLEKDENGAIKHDSFGRPLSTGAYERHMATYRQNWHGVMEDIGKNLIAQGKMVDDISGQDVIEALRILRIVSGENTAGESAQGNVKTATAAGEETLPAHIRQELEEGRRARASAQQAQATTIEQFRGNVAKATHAALETDVRNLLVKRLPKDAALTDYMKDVIVNDTVSSIERLTKANAVHQDLVTRAVRFATRDDAGIKKVVAQEQAFAKELLSRELAKVLSRATPGVVQQNASTHSKVQAQATRKEVATSGGVSTPSHPDARKATEAAVAAARKEGKVLSDMDIVDMAMAVQRR